MLLVCSMPGRGRNANRQGAARPGVTPKGCPARECPSAMRVTSSQWLLPGFITGLAVAPARLYNWLGSGVPGFITGLAVAPARLYNWLGSGAGPAL